MTISNFTHNLRFLCGKHTSISEVCRNLGMNRQQFNKYLSGTTRPSQRNLNRICEFFRISDSQLLLPHKEFTSKYGQNADFLFEQQFEKLFPTSASDLKRYLGYYHSYFYSLGYPGKIICSLVSMHEYKKRVFTKDIERLYDKKETARENKFINKYTGIVSYSCNRIFIMERDMLWGDAFNMTILYPTYQSHIKYLHGLSIGCPTLGRIPSCARIAYAYLGKEIDKRQALSRCGLYHPGDIDIPQAVLKLIDNNKHPDDFTFQAFKPGLGLEEH